MGQLDAAEFLLAARADVDGGRRVAARSGGGTSSTWAEGDTVATPLWVATSNGHDDVVALLISINMPANYDVVFYGLKKPFSDDGPGDKPISVAARQGNEVIVRLLSEDGAESTMDVEAKFPGLCSNCKFCTNCNKAGAEQSYPAGVASLWYTASKSASEIIGSTINKSVTSL